MGMTPDQIQAATKALRAISAGLQAKTRHVRDAAYWNAPVGTPLPLPDGTQMILPGMPAARESVAVEADDGDRMERRPVDDIDGIRKGAMHMQSLIDQYHEGLGDYDRPDDETRRLEKVARILRDEYGINVYDEDMGEDGYYGETLVSGSQWIYFGGCRDIREAAYDILGFDAYDRGADPHLQGGMPDWGYGSGGGSQPELMAYALLDKLKDADRTRIPIYRGVDLQGRHVGGFIEDLRSNPTFDLPLASFAGNRKATTRFGADVVFEVQPGARHIQGGFMGDPEEDNPDAEPLDYYEEQDPEYAEIVTGGRFKIVRVKEVRNRDEYGDETGTSTVVVTIKQVAVFDPQTGMSLKKPNQRWKWAYLFDDSVRVGKRVLVKSENDTWAELATTLEGLRQAMGKE